METVKLQVKAFCEKGADGSLRIIATDESMDRSGESIPFESWDLKNFTRSPRLLIDHDYSVKSIVGKATNIKKDPTLKALTFEPVFHDITQVARDTKELVDQGFLDTVSVGFLRKQDGKSSVNELMEISFVAVPANANARTLSVKDISGAEEKAVAIFIKGDEQEDKPAEEEVEEKGMIEDTIENSETMMKKKRAYLDAVWLAVYDFCNAYCSDAIAVESIGQMTQELAEKINSIASSNTPATPSSEDEDPLMRAIQNVAEQKGFLVFKAGRMLSEKNRGIISSAKDAMSSGIVALEELLSASETDTSKGVDGEKVENISREDLSYARFVELRQVVRVVSTALSDGLQKAKLTQ